MGTALTTPMVAWQYRGTVTAGITTPAVTARDKASVEALDGIFIDIMTSNNALLLRGSGGGVADSVNIYDMLFMADSDDHYSRVATLSFTKGLQTSPIEGEQFADLITVANEVWLTEILNASASDDYIGEIMVDLLGTGKVALIPTTIVTSSSIWYRSA